MRPRLACHECHLVNDPDKQTCENCGSSDLIEDWVGYVAIIHSEDSEIATEMNITGPGGYALRVH